VTIIRDGRTVESGTLAELRHLRRTVVRAEVERRPAGLDALVGVHDLDVEDGPPVVVSLSVDDTALAPVLAALGEAGVHSLTSTPPSLEQLFLDAYRGGPA
jgi:ABC-2 type transport system ATP-binding protein